MCSCVKDVGSVAGPTHHQSFRSPPTITWDPLPWGPQCSHTPFTVYSYVSEELKRALTDNGCIWEREGRREHTHTHLEKKKNMCCDLMMCGYHGTTDTLAANHLSWVSKQESKHSQKTCIILSSLLFWLTCACLVPWHPLICRVCVSAGLLIRCH